MFCSTATPPCVVNNKGKVPSPNKNIKADPSPTPDQPVAPSPTATKIAPYTKPQGKKPHNKPAIRAFGTLFKGNNLARKGASFCQSPSPSFSMLLSIGKPSINNAQNTNASPSKMRGKALSVITGDKTLAPNTAPTAPSKA